MEIVWILFLFVLEGFFCCTQISIEGIGEARLRKLEGEGEGRAKRVLRLRQDLALFSATMRFLSGLLLVLAVVLSMAFFLKPGMGALPSAPPQTAFLSEGGNISSCFSMLLPFVFLCFLLSILQSLAGNILPRLLAEAQTERIALSLSVFLLPFFLLFSPLLRMLLFLGHGLLRIFGIRTASKKDSVSEEDILQMVDEGTVRGTIESSEHEMIRHIFEFNDLTAEDVCTHRTDVALLYLEDSDRHWRRTIYENRFANYPICGEDDDDILGILDTKDYFRLHDQSRQNVMAHAVDKPFFVSQNMKVSDLFDVMKKERKYYAVVIDEYGGMTGIATLHDVLEAIVGDLQEEDALPEPEPIEQIGEGMYCIFGIADLKNVNEALGLSLPLESADTFGGYIMGIIGKVPEDGISFSLDTDDLHIDVVSIKNHRIGKTIVRRKTPDAGAGQREWAEPEAQDNDGQGGQDGQDEKSGQGGENGRNEKEENDLKALGEPEAQDGQNKVKKRKDQKQEGADAEPRERGETSKTD